MRYFLLFLVPLLIGCGNTEYTTREIKVEDRVLVVDQPDIHMDLPTFITDSLWVSLSPATSPVKVKVKTNTRTMITTVDVVIPDTTIRYKDTTSVQATTVIEKPGFFENLQTIFYIVLAIAIVVLAIKFLRH